MDPESARVIYHALQRHLLAKSVQLVAFRASVVYSFLNDDESWSILEWEETDGTQVMAIFYNDVYEPMNWSWVIHHGAGSPPGGGHWTRAHISWDVANITMLKKLFEGTQHALGLLQMPREDALKLYCQEHIEDPTSEEYE
jgi:hypothetical protein